MMKIQVFQKIIPQTNKRKLILLTLLGVSAFILTQCTVLSFYPLYTPDKLIHDERIVGTWMSKLISEEVSSDSLVWEITRSNTWAPIDDTEKASRKLVNKYAYELKLYPAKDSTDAAIFDIHIVQLENNLYLNFSLTDLGEATENMIGSLHVLTVYTFAKLEIGEEDLIVKWFNGGLLEDLLKNNRIRIKHERRDDDFLLTAQPKELQKFIIKYADKEGAFLEELSYVLTPYPKPTI